MRDDLMMALVDHAASDPAFRSALRADPDAALTAHGYTLADDERAAVRAFHAETAGLSDDDLTAALSGPRRQFGG